MMSFGWLLSKSPKNSARISSSIRTMGYWNEYFEAAKRWP